MENQSPTQNLLTKRKETTDKVRTQIKENLNYIYILLMVVANALISLLRVNGGEIGINNPTTTLGWILWCTQILAVTFIGVMIMSSFRRQGIKNGHTSIKATYDEYLKLITKQKDTNPRSLKEYMNQRALKDSIFKGTIFALINILVITIGISANFNSLIALIINILLATCFGIKAMLDAEDFVITELVVWYKLKINSLEKEKENESLRGDKQPKLRSSKSSGIQQKKKCNTRQSNTKSVKPVTDTVGTSSSGILA